MKEVYRTKIVEVPDALRQLGYGKDAWVRVLSTSGPGLPEETYRVMADADFQPRVDPLDHLPTTRYVSGIEAAKTEANLMLRELEQWPTQKYN